MNIRSLSIFITVAEVKNLTKASKILYMTPQGVSKVIKNLELECDCELFLRTGTGMELSNCGKSFYEYAKKAEEDHRDMTNQLIHIKQKEQDVVDLLSAHGILEYLSPECIVTFKKQYPKIKLSYREYPDKQVERWFQESEGNVAISLADFDDTRYEIYELGSFPVKLLVNQKHPLSKKHSVTIMDLKDEPVYIENEQFKIYDKIMNKCRDAGFEPNIIFETSGFSVCHKMVRDNKGISVTVDFNSNDMPRHEDGIVLLPFTDGVGGEYEWKMCMLIRKGEKPGRAVELFINHVKKWFDLVREGVIIS